MMSKPRLISSLSFHLCDSCLQFLYIDTIYVSNKLDQINQTLQSRNITSLIYSNNLNLIRYENEHKDICYFEFIEQLDSYFLLILLIWKRYINIAVSHFFTMTSFHIYAKSTFLLFCSLSDILYYKDFATKTCRGF